LTPFSFTNVPPGINCFNFALWHSTSDAIASGTPISGGWIKFTDNINLVLEVGSLTNPAAGTIGTQAS
jgi:hypothetical protein